MRTPARILAFETLPVVALALIVLWDAHRLWTHYATTVGAREGAAWMTLIGVLLLAAVAAILLRPPAMAEEAEQDKSGSVRPSLILTLTCLYILGLNYLGFIVSTIPFLVVYMVFISGRKALSSVIISLLFALAAAYVFDILLVPLPDGLFF